MASLTNDELAFCEVLKSTGDRVAAWHRMRPRQAEDPYSVALAGASKVLADIRRKSPEFYASLITDVQQLTPDLADLELLAGLQAEDGEVRQRAAQTAFRRYGREAPVKVEQSFPHLVPEEEELTALEERLSGVDRSGDTTASPSPKPAGERTRRRGDAGTRGRAGAKTQGRPAKKPARRHQVDRKPPVDRRQAKPADPAAAQPGPAQGGGRGPQVHGRRPAR